MNALNRIIHPAGQALFFIVLISVLIIYSVILIITSCNPYFFVGFGVIGLTVITFMFSFFRNPIRNIIPDNSIVYSPADGEIVFIDTVFENEDLNRECIKVSVFMSIYDVHVNRYPLGGKIRYTKYHPGRYFIARYPKSSEFNEHHSTVIETPEGTPVLVKQIAGTVARRIICYAKEGWQAIQGNDLGFIRFGSRVDLFLPLDAEILVKMNEKVKGNLSVIARLSNLSERLDNKTDRKSILFNSLKQIEPKITNLNFLK